jgi:polysaccharide export outer membrane protein
MHSQLRQIALAGAAVGAAVISGCTFLPSAGPSGYMVRAQAGKPGASGAYELVQINDQVIRAISSYSSRAPYLAADGRKSDSLFGPRGLEALAGSAPQTITVGDVVSVAIYETDSALFGPSLASGQLAVSPVTALPPQTVDRSGDISVPFVGRIGVLGRGIKEVESSIREGLRMKTADPQVIVTIAERKGGDLVSIAGDVKSPARLPVSLAGTRLIDAIASAGGSLSQPYDTMVSVTRGNTARSDTLQEVYDSPAKNISLQPGDTVVLRRRALSFLSFGSTGRVGAFPITVEDLNLSSAIAASGGPDDFEANPGTIFVYRQEPATLLRSLGKEPQDPGAATSPVVYQLDLHDPRGFFLANNFTVRDRDLVYYAAAGSSGVMKFMKLVSTLVAPAVTGVGVAGSASILANP